MASAVESRLAVKGHIARLMLLNPRQSLLPFHLRVGFPNMLMHLESLRDLPLFPIISVGILGLVRYIKIGRITFALRTIRLAVTSFTPNLTLIVLKVNLRANKGQKLQPVQVVVLWELIQHHRFVIVVCSSWMLFFVVLLAQHFRVICGSYVTLPIRKTHFKSPAWVY